MNSFVLMATVIRNPELRFTPDKQTAVCQFLVEFPGPREESPKETLKVVGWGNLANTINDSYRPGDRLLIEGRLTMNMIDRQEGFKEKRAELVASRIQLIDRDANFAPPSPGSDNVVPFPTPMESSPPTPQAPQGDMGGNLDDIPFVRPVYSKTSECGMMQDSFELSSNANPHWVGVEQFFYG